MIIKIISGKCREVMEELYKALDKLVEKNIIIDYELSDDFGNGWIDMYLKLEEEE
jgi:uncharacterized protein YebE (UPF0316 family)